MKAHYHTFTTRKGNLLAVTYEESRDTLVVDLVNKKETGGNEIVRMKIDEDKLLAHVKE